MNEVSIFIDESGDFGPLETHAQYYIVTLIIHEQTIDISDNILKLNKAISNMGFNENHSIHTGPLIRREADYINLTIDERKRIFNCLFNFTRTTDITYKTVCVDKRELNNQFDLNAKISKQLSAFLRDNIEYFISFDKVILYYDNGQTELTKILVSVFNSILFEVDVRKVLPMNYKLFQTADLICTLKLLSLKSTDSLLSNSEHQFFGSARDLKKNYIKPILKKEFNKI
ncbi:MAG: DUF3800 domain-containing protein [Acutalibacteraceae bacterium]